MSALLSGRSCFRFVAVHSLQGRTLLHVGRRVPRCLTEASELAIFTVGVMGWACQDPGPPVSSGNPIAGSPEPEGPLQISAQERVIVSYFLVSSQCE